MKLFLLLIISLIRLTTTNGQIKMRPLEQLVIKESNTWSIVKDQIKKARNPVQILPKDQMAADSALFQAQVTTRSSIGSIIYETGGILIDRRLNTIMRRISIDSIKVLSYKTRDFRMAVD